MNQTANTCRASLIFTALILMTAANADDNCRHRMDIFEEVQLDGISEIVVDAGAGKLIVVGEPGVTQVQIDGVACATDEDDLKQISVKSTRDGETLVLRTEIPRPAKSWMGSKYARLDLELNVPDNLPIRVTDTSGSLKVSDVAAVAIEDGSGSIQVQDVSGDVEIISDGSGSISVVRSGSVHITEDGSGSITAAQIENDVYVGRDGSGSISAKDVGGNFIVKSDGSGSVSHRRVAGAVKISD
ncbi:MAG: hypothetical protein AB8F65_10835 [Woeseiaceae bacterium]